MSDSESDALSSANLPDDKTLEKALRNAVATIYRSGKMEELTVRRVRSAAEKALDLEEGFFKGYEAWKSRSDKIIKDEVVYIFPMRQIVSVSIVKGCDS